MWRGWRIAVAILFGLATGTGCMANTKYTPKGRRATLVVTEGRLSLSSSGKATAVSDVTPTWFACDGEAQKFAETFRGHQDKAEDMRAAAATLNSVGVYIPLLLLFAIPIAVVADTHADRATASLVDAVNRHNDVSKCAGPVKRRKR